MTHVTDTPFDSFIVLAEMRTGSNFLEANINEFATLRCLGEAYNPSFIGHPNQSELFGYTKEQREADPLGLLDAMKAQCDGVPGFRFFHDHDPRVLEHCLNDRRCAKVVLTRNPLESYISLRIANQTGQWKLTNVKHQRQAKVHFDGRKFEAHLDRVQAFQIEVMHALQVSGQTAFYIDYEDIQEVEVLNGLARFLGTEERIEALSKKLKKQNPEPVSAKVDNPDEMEAALVRLDRFNLSRTPNFEPRRGPSVPGFHAAQEVGLLYMPVKGGPEARVLDWLGRAGGGVTGGFTQKTLRQWRRRHPGHRSFTVLRHPVARAHAAFCSEVLGEERAGFRSQLARGYKLPLPEEAPGPGYDLAAHRAAFLGFLGFVKKNLSGQTGMRVDPAWASQVAVLQGYAQLATPDVVMRETRLAEGLAWLAGELGIEAPALAESGEDTPFALDDIYDEEIEAAARDAYPRDYLTFGFGDWRG